MGWFWKFTNSSIGKKLVMSITGILLIIFLIIHLAGNLTLYWGEKAFITYAGTLELLKPLIRIIEVLLALVFIFHIINGVRVWWGNKKSKPIDYKINAKFKNSSIFSRTMIQSASIIFIFLVIHLDTIWYPYNVGTGAENLYGIVTSLFAIPLYSWFYIFAMVLLGFHLNHGFQSAFQTMGWNHKKYFPLIQKIGTIYAILMAVGFASLPIYFLYFHGR